MEEQLCQNGHRPLEPNRAYDVTIPGVGTRCIFAPPDGLCCEGAVVAAAMFLAGSECRVKNGMLRVPGRESIPVSTVAIDPLCPAVNPDPPPRRPHSALPNIRARRAR